MRRYALLASIVLVPFAGCQRDTGAPSPAGSIREESPTTSAPDSGDARSQPVTHWECDGGVVLTTKYLPRDRAISLGLHEGERKLPQVASGSGEKYQEGPITFWRKGGEAIYERTPAPQIECRLAQSAP